MTCPLHPAASAYGCRHCNARARTHGKDTERSLVGRLTAMLEAERAAHEETKRELVSETLRLLDCAEKAERERDEARAQLELATLLAKKSREERDEARARVAQLEEALGSVRDDIGVMNTSAHDDAIQACHDHAEQLIRAALSASPSDWLAEHDRSIAERQREACAKSAALAPNCELHEHGPCEWDGACDAIAELVRATPLVTK